MSMRMVGSCFQRAALSTCFTFLGRERNGGSDRPELRPRIQKQKACVVGAGSNHLWPGFRKAVYFTRETRVLHEPAIFHFFFL